jgi:hypothetical protein
MNTGEQGHFDAAYRRVRRLWLMMMASSAMYVVVALAVSAFTEWPFSGFFELSTTQEDMYLGAAALISLGDIAVAYALQRRQRGEAQPSLTMEASALIMYACIDVLGILGLVFYLMSGRRLESSLLLGLSLFLMAACFPRRELWEKRSRY